jgi:hypothetical protein
MSGGMGGSETGVPDDLLTTKGDTHGFTTENARVPIGIDTTVLTADSTTALGLAWTAPAGGATVTAFEFTQSTSFSTSSSSYVDVTNLTVDKPTITDGECMTTYNISMQNDNDGKLYSKLIDNTTAVAAAKSEFSMNKDTGLTASDTSDADGATLKVQIKASAGSSTLQYDFVSGGDRMTRICGLGVG